MKRTLIAAAAGVCVLLSHSAVFAQKVDAESAKAAAKQGGCLNCHEIDKKKVGPAFQDSAAKYKGKSVKSKPAHAGAVKQTSDKDLKLIADWIVTLGK
jgi:cytochrome c551/c552